MSLTELTPTFTFKELYDDYNELVNYFNSKEPILDTYPLNIDTSAKAIGLFGYLDYTGNVELAYAGAERIYWSDFFIVTSAVDGSIIQFGTALGALVEDSITITAGDLIYLTESSVDPGKITNVPTSQYLGKAITSSVAGKADIWYKTADSFVTLTEVNEFIDGTDFTSATTTELTLSVLPANEDDISVFFDGVHQKHTNFSLADSVITFDAAIVATVVEVVIRYGENYHLLITEFDADSANKETVEVVTINKTVEKYFTYVLASENLVLTMFDNPTSGNWVKFINISGGLTCIIEDTNLPIETSNDDLEIDVAKTSFRLTYVDVTRGWVVS